MPRSAASGRVNRSAARWQRSLTTRIDGHTTWFNLHFVEIGAQVREHEHTRRDDGDGRRSASDRRWKRLDERFGLGASKDTVGGRARAKVPRLDLLMKPLRPAGPPLTEMSPAASANPLLILGTLASPRALIWRLAVGRGRRRRGSNIAIPILQPVDVHDEPFRPRLAMFEPRGRLAAGVLRRF